MVIDDILCDGGSTKVQGWVNIPPLMNNINAYEFLNLAPNLNGKLLHLRLYDRFLYTNEIIGIWRKENSRYNSDQQHAYAHVMNEHINVV